MTDAFQDWVGALDRDVSVNARPLLRDIFERHGPVPRERVERIFAEHQVRLAAEAWAHVANDVRATTSVEPPPFEYREEAAGIRPAFWGQYDSSPILGLTQAEVTVEVASLIQQEVAEDLHSAWPECREHGCGLHPRLAPDRAEWVCRAGGHVAAGIGELGGLAD